MTEKLKKGDVVRLKSGGPLMTVQQVEDRPGLQAVHCVWFSSHNPSPLTNVFDGTTLEVVEAESGQ
jgi:uncharacterized protein YodC (DUF2158 family)